MSAFIVSGGALLEVGCPSRLDRSTDQQVSFTRTLGGKRKAFIRKGGRRTWSIDVSLARPAEVSTIEAIARNLRPVGWYGPEAVIGNLLSPEASGFGVLPLNGADMGLVQLPDGTVARTVLHETYRVIVEETPPVRPGEPVTVSGWGLGGMRLLGNWVDARGDVVGEWDSGPNVFEGWWWREYTMTAPPTATAIQLHLLGGTQYALPSVAWGEVGRPELGTGCTKAVIHSPSHSPVALWKGANYTDSSYSVTEVG